MPMLSIDKLIKEKNFELHFEDKKCFMFSKIKFSEAPAALAEGVFKDMVSMTEDEYFLTKLIQKKADWRVSSEDISVPKVDDEHPWTLLAHNLDKYNLDLHELLKNFDIFPSWAVDDIMGSFSTTNSITPSHIDSYDVFLLQITGKRRWSIEYKPDETYQKDQPLRILERFKPSEHFELEPGDMLYVPAGVAHEATTLEAGLSLSIGIQSLNLKDLLMELSSNENIEKAFYRTPLLLNTQEPEVINQKTIDQIKMSFIDNIIHTDYFVDSIIRYMNRYQSERELDLELSLAEFSKAFTLKPLFRSELSKFIAFEKGESHKIAIGEAIVTIQKEEFKALANIFRKNLEYEITYKDFGKLTPLLHHYYKEGILFFNDEN